ncbi:MAG TPA: DegT/DnrJ/EryC1/StrS family aminotransferase [Thermoanaerobaculia bacterium]|nr:DegT/DnrJ/EryC1/StrS family aminotransferase [Thermoanaerobaculia bacterium]
MTGPRIPFLALSLHEDAAAVRAAIDRVVSSGWFVLGPEVDAFESEFAAACGAARAVGVGSGTDAIALALKALGIGPGDEVITTPLTFVATLNTIVLCGAVPVLADIDAATLNVRVEEIAKRVTARTKAIVPVHYVGQAADLDPIMELAAGRGIAVLEDAAHAIGSEYKGRKIGSFPTTSVFSFHPNKNITTGEGGMIVTDDEAVFEKASLLKFHGMDREAWKRFAKSGSPRYDVALPGFKYNMMDIQAALGIHQLPRLPGFLAERARLAARYDRLLSGVAGLILPQRVPYPVKHAWHLYTPLVDIDRLTVSRDRFMEELKKRNIGTGLHYSAAHEFSYYADRFGWKPGDFPEAHFVSERIVSLPLFPGLSDADQDDAVAAIREVLQESAR